MNYSLPENECSKSITYATCAEIVNFLVIFNLTCLCIVGTLKVVRKKGLRDV